MGDTLEQDDPYADTYANTYGGGPNGYSGYNSGLPDETEVGEAPAGGGYGPVISRSGGGPALPALLNTPGSQAAYGQITQARDQTRAARLGGGGQGTPGEIYEPPVLYPEPKVEPGWWHDAVRKVWASTQQMGEGVLGAAAQVQEAIGASPEAKAWVQDRRKELEASIQTTVGSMSADRQRAAGASLFGGSDPVTGERYPTPGEVGWKNYITDRVLGFVPQAAFLALPGGAAGRIAQGLIFGTLGSGDAYNAIADQIGKMTPEQLKDNPLSREVLNSGGSIDDARHALLQTQATSWQAIGHAATGAVMGAGLGGIVGRGGGAIGAAGRGRLAHAGLGAAEAGGVLGGASGSTEALGQSQQIDIGTRREMDPSAIARSVAAGTVGGVILGGSMGLLKGGPRGPVPAPKPEATIPEGVPPDVHAALQGELDLTVAPPGVSAGAGAGAGQGELFRGITEANARPAGPEPPPPPGPPGPPGAPPPGGGGGPPVQGDLGLRQPPAPPGFIEGAPQGEIFPGQEMGPAPGESVPETSNGANVPLAGQDTGKLPGAPGSEVISPTVTTPGQDTGKLPGTPPGSDIISPTVTQGAPAPTTEAPLTTGQQHAAARGRPVTTVGKSAKPAEIPPKVVARTEKNAGVAEPAEVIPPKVAEPAAEPAAKSVAEATLEAIPEKPPSPTAEAGKTELPTASEPIAPIEAPKLTKAQQLIADAKAKRAAQRAKITGAPIEREQPKAHVEAEAPESAAPAPEIAPTPQRPGQRNFREEVVTAVKSPAIAREIVPLKASGVPAAVERVLRELEARLEETGSPEEAHAEISRWAASPDPIPGTKTRRDAIANPLLRMLTGESLIAHEARAEARGQETKFETEREGETTVHEAAAGAEGADKPHAPTTDREKLAYRLLDEVRQGTKTAAEAHAEYGEPTKGPGRPRRDDLATFPDFLAREIKRAEDPTLREAIIAALTRTQKDTGERGTTKGNTTKAEEELLARTSPEYLAELRELHREITDPVGLAADREAARRERGGPLANQAESASGTGGGVKYPLSENLSRGRERGPLADETGERGGIKPGGSENLSRGRERYQEQRARVNRVLQMIEARRQILDRQRRLGESERAIADTLRGIRDDVQLLAEMRERLNPSDQADLDRLLGRTRRITAEAPGPTIDLGNFRDPEPLADRIGPAVGPAVSGSAKLQNLITRARARAQARLDGLRNPMSSRFVRVREDPRLNDHIHNAVFEGDATLHGLLRSVINHAATRDELRPLWELAKILLDKVPDLPVVSGHEAHGRGWMDQREAERFAGGRTAGYYWPEGAGAKKAPAHIAINPGTPSAIETLLHEAMHATTHGYITKLEWLAHDHGVMAPEYIALNAIKEQFLNAVNQRIREGYYGSADRELINRVSYMITNAHELHTILYTDPRMQALAADLPAPNELRSTLTQLGFAPRPAGTSIWRYWTDWVYRALGIKRPASESEYTMLDTILRPLQDITDRAVSYNRERAQTRSDLESDAAPLRDVVTRAFSSGREEAADRLSRVGHVARRAFLPAMGTDRIRDRYGHLFDTPEGNLFDAHRTATERISAAGKKFFDDHQDALMGLARKLRGRDELAALMNDTTLAKVHLDNPDPTANDHLTTVGEQATQRELEARFAKLSNADKALYRETRDTYQKLYTAERTAELNGLVNKFLGDLTPDQQATVRAALRSKRALDAFLKDPENSIVGRAFAGNPEGWANYRGVIRGMAQFHQKGFVQGDYFPLRRNGDYVVVYGEKGTENYGVEMFESPAQAEVRRQELIQQGVPDVYDTQIRDTNTQTRLPPSSVTDELVTAAKNIPGLKDSIAELQSALDTIRLRHMTYSEVSRVRARRRGIAGASKEASRILAGEGQSLGMRIGYLEHGDGPTRALNAMRAQRNLLARTDADQTSTGRSSLAGDVINELAKRDGIADSATRGVGSMMRKATSFGYVQSLLSFSRIATEAVEHSLHAGVWLGARHGYGAAGLALARAIKDTAPTLVLKGAKNTLSAMKGELRQADWNMAILMRDRAIKSGSDRGEMEALFSHGIETGLLDMSFSRALQHMAQPGGGRFVEPWQRFLDMSGAMQHATEASARGATFLAAYRLERAKGATPAASRRYAEDMLRKLPNWNPGMKPRITTDKGVLGPFGAPITQFKNYGLNAYALMANLMRDSFGKTATPEQRREARWVLAGTLASHTMTAGALTWLADPLRYIGGAYDLFSGNLPHDYQADVRAFASDVFGPEIGEVAMRGFPHMAGIDVHNRLGMQNVLNIPQLNGFTKKDWIEWLGTAAMGAAGEDAATAGGGFYKMLTGDMSGMLDVVPRLVRDPLKAGGLATKGVTDSTGKQILAPEKITPYDVGVQALGFQPSVVSEKREQRNAILQVRTEWIRDHNALVNQWLDTPPSDRPGVMSAIREFNSTHHGMQITMNQLLQNQASRAKQARGPAGLRLTPKTARELTSYGRFVAQQ